MVHQLRLHGDLRTDQVTRAFATVPREAFAPGEPLSKVYDRAAVVITKRDEHGLAVSSVSAPWIQAKMLEQADIRPGMRVLEIGSGGYNAALIAELVGPQGEVTTMDIDPFVVDRATQFLDIAGYPQVRVIAGDADVGLPDHSPFDRIIVTVGAPDIPPAWIEQLAADGVLVVPLRLRGLMRSIAFTRHDDRLVGTDYEICGFVAMQGAGASNEQLVPLGGPDIALRVDGDQPVNGEALSTALASPRVVHGSGIEVGGTESYDDLDLYLATMLDDFGLLMATQAAIATGAVEKSTRMGAKAAFGVDSFAYRAPRATSEDRSAFELVVYAHGPDADHLAGRYVELIRDWDRTRRHGPGARIDVYPATTPDPALPAGRVVRKKHTVAVISWPSTPS